MSELESCDRLFLRSPCALVTGLFPNSLEEPFTTQRPRDTRISET
jgi:hypothetical protein